MANWKGVLYNSEIARSQRDSKRSWSSESYSSSISISKQLPEGNAVGTLLGSELGASEGEEVGFSEGSELGEAEGEALGRANKNRRRNN